LAEKPRRGTQTQLCGDALALFSHKVPRRVNHVFAETCFFGKKSAHRRKTSVFLSGTHKAAGQTSGGLQQCRLNRAACKRFKHSL
jgi:hypothetical protein